MDDLVRGVALVEVHATRDERDASTRDVEREDLSGVTGDRRGDKATQ